MIIDFLFGPTDTEEMTQTAVNSERKIIELKAKL